MLDESLKKNVIEDATLLKLCGFKPIIVHGGGKERNETFYFLFTPTLNQEGSFIYQVEAQLMQDWPTERSELYPLTANLSLTATRTGNLVALRHTSADWTLDLLLDLREVHGDGE